MAISGSIVPAFNNVTYGDDAAASDTSDTSLIVLKWVAKKGMNRSFGFVYLRILKWHPWMHPG